jgi:GPH family glycoside/pentoside/hexuronide:cation symporter
MSGLRRDSRWLFAAYGSGNLSLAAYYVISSSFMLFATSILGLPPWVAGLLMAASTVWDALTDMPMGWLSDASRSVRFGRRHGYLLVGAVAVAVSSIWLWSLRPDGPLWWTATQLGLAVFAVKTALTVFVVPYIALADELGENEHARGQLHAWRGMFQFLSIVVTAVGGNLIFFRATEAYPRGQLNPDAYAPMGWALAVLVLLAGGFSAWTTRHARHAPLPKHGRAFLPQLSEIWRSHNARRLFGMILCIETTFQIGIALGSHVYTYTYQVGAHFIALFGIAVLLPAALGQFLWAFVADRVGKKTALFWAAGFALSGAVLGPVLHVGLGVFPLEPDRLAYSLTPFLMLQGLGAGAFSSLPFRMIGDCARASVPAGEAAPEGTWIGFYTLGYKLGGSISLMLAGVILQQIGFDAAQPTQASSVRDALAMAPALLLLLIAPLAAWLLAGYREGGRDGIHFSGEPHGARR